MIETFSSFHWLVAHDPMVHFYSAALFFGLIIIARDVRNSWHYLLVLLPFLAAGALFLPVVFSFFNNSVLLGEIARELPHFFKEFLELIGTFIASVGVLWLSGPLLNYFKKPVAKFCAAALILVTPGSVPLFLCDPRHHTALFEFAYGLIVLSLVFLAALTATFFLVGERSKYYEFFGAFLCSIFVSCCFVLPLMGLLFVNLSEFYVDAIAEIAKEFLLSLPVSLVLCLTLLPFLIFSFLDPFFKKQMLQVFFFSEGEKEPS